MSYYDINNYNFHLNNYLFKYYEYINIIKKYPNFIKKYYNNIENCKESQIYFSKFDKSKRYFIILGIIFPEKYNNQYVYIYNNKFLKIKINSNIINFPLKTFGFHLDSRYKYFELFDSNGILIEDFHVIYLTQFSVFFDLYCFMTRIESFYITIKNKYLNYIGGGCSVDDEKKAKYEIYYHKHYAIKIIQRNFKRYLKHKNIWKNIWKDNIIHVNQELLFKPPHKNFSGGIEYLNSFSHFESLLVK